MKEYETSDFGGKGRKADQKLKPFLVLQYLMKYSDDEHVVSASDLVGYLREIENSAERRFIQRPLKYNGRHDRCCCGCYRRGL